MNITSKDKNIGRLYVINGIKILEQINGSIYIKNLKKNAKIFNFYG